MALLGEDGQAMAEYSLTASLLIGLGGISLFFAFQGLEAAYVAYMDGFLFSLAVPFP
jgi:hypothetical protein